MELPILFEKLNLMRVSITEFSKMTGIPQNRIYQWKTGKGRPKAEDAKVITKWLLENTDFSKEQDGGETPITSESPEVLSYIAKYEELNGKYIKLLEKTIMDKESTVAIDTKMLQDLTARVLSLQDILLEVALGRRFETREEVVQELGKGDAGHSLRKKENIVSGDSR